ncbi:hypothetical protein FQZ97_1090430 [compost metagenome]
MLDGLGTQGLYLGNGIRARHPSLDQDASSDQPGAARAALTVDGEVLATIDQAENLLLRPAPGLIEVTEGYLLIRHRQLKPIQAQLLAVLGDGLGAIGGEFARRHQGDDRRSPSLLEGNQCLIEGGVLGTRTRGKDQLALATRNAQYIVGMRHVR